MNANFTAVTTLLNSTLLANDNIQAGGIVGSNLAANTITGTKLSTTLAIPGTATVASTLGVTGATTLSSTLAVTGAATLSSTLAVSGAATLSSTLAVAGTSSLGGDTTVTGNLAATGVFTLGSGPILEASGNNLNLNNAALRVQGGAYLNPYTSNTLAVSEGTTGRAIVVSAGAPATGMMVVQGHVSTTGTLTLSAGCTASGTNGSYTITFSTAFAAAPVVIATPDDASDVVGCVASSIGTSSCAITCINASRAPAAAGCNFLIIGRR